MIEIKCYDKFNQVLSEGDYVDVQKVGPHKIYKKDDGQLYFKPYGEEEMVVSYSSNDMVKCDANGNWLTNDRYENIEDETPKEPTIDDGWLSPMQRFRLREDKPSTTQEPKITLELTQQEARGLLNCLMRTSANGKDLDVGEIIEEKLWEFLKPLETK